MALDLVLPGATATGLDLPDGLSFDDWRRVMHGLARVYRASQWLIGDGLRYGERVYGETYAQVVDELGLDYQTVANCVWVAGQFEFSRRRENLPWGHHDAVAALPPALQDEMLDRAEREEWTRADLRQEVRRLKNATPVALGPTCTVADLTSLSDAGHRFGTIYADPPWLYGNQGTRAATGNHYGGMTVEEIAALPIAGLAAENAHLHLWTTNAFLFDARVIMEAWGFTYKSCFVWVKPQMGIGNYWRVSHEFMVFGVRGDAPFRDRGLMSWLECERGKHSAKPDQIRALIERASPGPYLELFGRRAVHGWAVWGNEVSRDLLTADIEELAS